MFQSPQVQLGPTILQRLWEVNKGNGVDQEVIRSSLSAFVQVASMLSILVNCVWVGGAVCRRSEETAKFF